MRITTFDTNLIGTGIIELFDSYIIDGIYYNKNLSPLPINKQINYSDFVRGNSNYTNNFYTSMPLFNNRIVTRTIPDHVFNWKGVISMYNISQEPHSWHGLSIDLGTNTYKSVIDVPNGGGFRYYNGQNITTYYTDLRNGIELMSKINDNRWILHRQWGGDQVSRMLYSYGSVYHNELIAANPDYHFIQFIGRDTTNLFFVETSSARGHRVIRYNSSNNTVTALDTESRSNNIKVLSSHHINDPKTENITRFYRFYTDLTNITARLVTVNFGTSTVTKQNITINGTAGTLFDASLPNAEEAAICPFVHKYNNELYVSFITVRTRGASQSTSQTFAGHGYIYTYKINANDPTQITFVTKYRFTSDEIWGFFFMDNAPDITNLTNQRNKLIIAGNNAVYFATFSGDRWNVRSYAQIPATIMMDSNDRIFVLNMNFELYLLSEEVPLIVKITPERSTYTYIGVPINTYVDLDVFNYNNDRLSVTGDLHILSSNAVFTDDTRVKTITTSNTESTRVNIKVVDSGQVFMKFVIRVT